MPLSIEARGLGKSFELGGGAGARPAVDGATFSIREGERVGFIGRNGAGKSTLLQMLAGITAASEGTLDIVGHVTAIFTLGLGLRDDLTGLENIFVESELLGRSREQTQELIAEIVEFADLGPFIERPVRTYSTGMKARLAFSTIVHVEPEILIIDEALSVGDAKFSAKATAKMQELASRGRILILVSHSMQAIETMCTRCIWLDAGRIRMDGPPAAVTQAYLEEVREQDEAGVLTRLRHALVHESLDLGWEIKALQLLGAEDLPAEILTTGEAACFSMDVSGPAGARFSCRLKLARLDGLEVMRTSLDGGAAAFDIGTGGTRRVRADLGRQPLNFGVYKAEFEILHGEAAVARRSMLFEVRNPRPHRGGRPVLVYPARLSVAKLSS